MPVRNRKIYPHGNYLRYLFNGCRCPDCRRHATFMRAKSRVQYEREGPVLVPAADLLSDLKDLKRVGWTLAKISRGSGVSRNTLNDSLCGRRESVWARTYDKVHALWQDVFGESGELYDPSRPYRLRAGSGKRGPAIWPKQALKDRIVERRGEITEYENSKIRSGDGELWTTVRADRTAVEMGFLPWEVWDGWTERAQLKVLERIGESE